jgi:hypothetical protein
MVGIGFQNPMVVRNMKTRFVHDDSHFKSIFSIFSVNHLIFKFFKSQTAVSLAHAHGLRS